MVQVTKLVPRGVFRATMNVIRRVKYAPFEKSLARAGDLQREWLLQRVRRCAATRFGRDHGFDSIRTLEEFRSRVPIAPYSYFAPYINDVAAGKTEALIPADDPLMQFTITTGSTGVPKLNPVTKTWLKEYQRGWDVWGTKLFTDHPRLVGSRVLQMAGTWNMGKTPGGYQISMVSALLARTQSPLMKPFYAIPEAVNDIKDPVVRHYVALRLCILDDIGWIMLMNPGTLLRLAEIGDLHREVLIKDVSDGTLTSHFEIPAEIRTRLGKYIPKKDPAGARRLEELVKQRGRLLPSDYWKQPAIACWLGGTAGFQSRYLDESFAGSPLRDMGLVSSEGRHTIPLENNFPHGVPSVGAGFYEFVPTEGGGNTSPDALQGEELTVGKEYRIVISNAAGYFRFDLGDIVRCNGFVGEAPLLEFRQKNDRIGDLEGEKVTEHQILEGAHRAAEKLGIQLGLLTGVPRREGREKPWYDFLVSIADIPDVEHAKRFLSQLDVELAEINFLWRARRKEGVVAAPRLWRLAPDAWDESLQRDLAQRGTGDYQYKHPGLVQDQRWLERFSPVDTLSLD